MIDWTSLHWVGSRVIDYCTEKQKPATYKEYMFRLNPKVLGYTLEDFRKWWCDFYRYRNCTNSHTIMCDEPFFKEHMNILFRMNPDYLRDTDDGHCSEVAYYHLLENLFNQECEDIGADGIGGSYGGFDTYINIPTLERVRRDGEYWPFVKNKTEKHFWDLDSSYTINISYEKMNECLEQEYRAAIKLYITNDDESNWMHNHIEDFVKNIEQKSYGLFTFMESKEIKARPRKPVEKVVKSYKLKDQYDVDIDVGDTVVYPKGGDHNYYYCRKGIVKEILYLKSSDKEKEVLDKSFILVEEEDGYTSKTLPRKVVVAKKADGSPAL